MRQYWQSIMNNKTCIFTIFLLVLFTTVDSFEEEEDVECDIKPGGARPPLHCEKEWDDVTCKFSYVAQGGTNEEWTLKLSRNKDQTEFTCSIERPSGKSYLFFEEFHLAITGAEIVDAEVFGPNMAKLKSKEYKFNATTVSEVQGEFSSQLDKVLLKAIKKTEAKKKTEKVDL